MSARAEAPHRLSIRVYYEDTDLAGIVYYANYLKFIERGRSEWLRALGLDQAALLSARGLAFAVRRVEADYLAPAGLDDLLEVISRPVALTPARLVLHQQVARTGQVLFDAQVTLACVDTRARPPRPVRLPQEFRQKLAPHA